MSRHAGRSQTQLRPVSRAELRRRWREATSWVAPMQRWSFLSLKTFCDEGVSPRATRCRACTSDLA